ncbi:alternate F1F0 ATPase, F1 subunit alpha [Chlorobaculum thiosulfatiphilum]|uniref:ATP synthase subunit alpha n=1 Tax=Chlorobaculum thiosulfatiphilum TaxID=115852 RepID=A0A5C4S4R1_CHLTI|nr:alternate F1F0 ATPase, F1 subunit alpha [Chlorobaculum thiosulfatiphilum]TNJ38202.1 alternate F1F0 ATPase, F1 subunit alpha [Chlorobaculum thiosulfatiphilum]
MPDKSGHPLDKALESVRQARVGWSAELALVEEGVVTTVLNGIVKIDGLPGVGYEELVQFHDNLYGIAFNIDPGEVGVVLLGDYARIRTGERAWRTGRVTDVPVGEALIGRVIDPLGQPLDELGPIRTTQRLPIMDRDPVTVPLQTGIKVIDAIVPVGRGQRELILGDRQTGKTSVALSAMINQRGNEVLCIYCAIGQKAASVAKAVAMLRERGALEHSIVVVTEGNDPPGLQYIAPYAATSIAEYFMQQGRDVLIVYDDLTNHARAYRELSLLLKRPPGREAFPGDIFYIHSRLLERATHLRRELGGGSLTALPIIETEAQNIAAYIPTNLISITDGQLYLSPTLFELGILPAVDIGKSVSRVGGKAQLAAYRSVTGSLKLAYAQFEELENFARFGTRLDEASRTIIEHGQRIRECFKQDEFDVLSLSEQMLVLLALTGGGFEQIALEKMREAMEQVRKAASELPEELVARILSSKALDEDDRSVMLATANRALERFGNSS